SNLGLPLTGVGLLYQKGYFRQYLNYEGWQGERYVVNDFHNMPVEEARDNEGNEITVEIGFPKRTVYAKVWKVRVGRIELYLLDTNITQNSDSDRWITDELYGGDIEKRIQQEIVLGIGGVRAINKLGFTPTVYHMNEGHSAFLGLERTRMIMEKDGLSFREAIEVCRAGTIFTTHTPVPAGIDVFPVELMRKYFFDYVKSLQITWDEFHSLGTEKFSDRDKGFSMAFLAFHLSDRYNGVSKLHGKVSRNLFSSIWPGLPEEEVPITSITNGVHHKSWISHDMESLYHRYLGVRWLSNPEDQKIWEEVERIPNEELWRTHEIRRERLVAFARRRLRRQLAQRGAPETEAKRADEVLNPDILTIGFARRFASYKRADLILRHPERLAELMNNDSMPVQIIFSGKAHPRDIPGKELIRELIHLAEREEFRKRIVFLEDYDMNIARYLVQGVDIWLNTPRRLYEASGTSGMKAAANGALNMSILDGWWDEAFKPGIGWAIGKGEEYKDIDYQYDVEANAIYDLLGKDIIPLFYSRGSDNLPRGWIRYMKDSIKSICPVFNSHRMVFEYTERFYMDAGKRVHMMSDNGFEVAKSIAVFRERLAADWDKIKVENVDSSVGVRILTGENIGINVKVFLGDIVPEDIDVQVYEGSIDSEGEIVEGKASSLNNHRVISDGRYEYSGSFVCSSSGLQGFTVRIMPKNKNLDNSYIPGLIKWA
ncbi:MAG TPA: alpha-glucan family phosphorylase, partial [Nitrospirae bacterium]|nr:alpha-glucan family phosphorylase [Nitrospirota bacterium]